MQFLHQRSSKYFLVIMLPLLTGSMFGMDKGKNLPEGSKSEKKGKQVVFNNSNINSSILNVGVNCGSINVNVINVIPQNLITGTSSLSKQFNNKQLFKNVNIQNKKKGRPKNNRRTKFNKMENLRIAPKQTTIETINSMYEKINKWEENNSNSKLGSSNQQSNNNRSNNNIRIRRQQSKVLNKINVTDNQYKIDGALKNLQRSFNEKNIEIKKN
jgi:hypothetical protein